MDGRARQRYISQPRSTARSPGTPGSGGAELGRRAGRSPRPGATAGPSGQPQHGETQPDDETVSGDFVELSHEGSLSRLKLGSFLSQSDFAGQQPSQQASLTCLRACSHNKSYRALTKAQRTIPVLLVVGSHGFATVFSFRCDSFFSRNPPASLFQGVTDGRSAGIQRLRPLLVACAAPGISRVVGADRVRRLGGTPRPSRRLCRAPRIRGMKLFLGRSVAAATRGGRGRCRPCRPVPRAARRWPALPGRT
jgi:hypothetical protein